jgi:hypothetical protein
MNKFLIYHPINGDINSTLLEDTFQYEKVFTIYSINLNTVFAKCSNINPKYFDLGIRNTTVGDIIINATKNEYYFVTEDSFKEITSFVLDYFNDVPKDDFESIYNDFSHKY